MYSESDIEAAVASGALTPEAAAAFRQSVSRGRLTPLVDEESFRLITGFNDIFVSIAAILLLVAVGWIGGSFGGAFHDVPANDTEAFRFLASRSLLGAAAVAGASWLLAEYFTRRRRMALPSILLLGAFVFAVGSASYGLMQLVFPVDDPRGIALRASFGALVSAGAAWAHWQRFHVPITIAALTGALVVMLQGLFTAMLPDSPGTWLWFTLASGLAVFAFAMWWDISDPTRTTRRSDVAFWLHLTAAPMIAHPIFWLLGVASGTIGVTTALLVIALYLVFGVIALAIDRRALLVSSLFYVLYALAALFRQFGAVGLNVALTALVIGSALLMLSAFWQVARRMVVDRLPPGMASRLPALDRPISAAP